MTTMSLLQEQQTKCPGPSWVPVTGPDGRTRMEMRWHVSRPGVPTRTHRAA
jgi:hypothetical protein